MLIIEHRRNNSETLDAVPFEYGCEIDIRNHGKKLIVTHDPFQEDGEEFGYWLKKFKHRFLIINVKEEGLEEEIFSLLKLNSVSNFFILDESFPYIRKWAQKGIENFAVRVSEFENYRTALDLACDLRRQGKRVRWIWADCFIGDPLPSDVFHQLKNAGFDICCVSPELHFLSDPVRWDKKVAEFTLSLRVQGITPDAVCTKLPALWKNFSLHMG